MRSNLDGGVYADLVRGKSKARKRIASSSRKPAERNTRSIATIDAARKYLEGLRSKDDLRTLISVAEDARDLARSTRATAASSVAITTVERALGMTEEDRTFSPARTRLATAQGTKIVDLSYRAEDRRRLETVSGLAKQIHEGDARERKRDNDWKMMAGVLRIYCDQGGLAPLTSSELVALEVIVGIAEPTIDFNGRLDRWIKRQPSVEKAKRILRPLFTFKT